MIMLSLAPHARRLLFFVFKYCFRYDNRCGGYTKFLINIFIQSEKEEEEEKL